MASISIFVCHSPYYVASHYLRMKSIPVAQARGISPFWNPQALSQPLHFTSRPPVGGIPSPPTRPCSSILSSLWPPALPSSDRALCTVGQHQSHSKDHIYVSIPPLFPASVDSETILLTSVTSGNFWYLVGRSEVQLTKHLCL